MNIESFRQYCISKKGTTEDLPFDENTLAFRVMGKIFALTDIDAFESVNLKCDPARALELRNQYQGIVPGYHMNKQHWNTVMIDSDVSDQLLCQLVDHSYDLIVNGLPRKLKAELENLPS
jgi:predicted DNA-binding protein (MmcQ/YjbR family)